MTTGPQLVLRPRANLRHTTARARRRSIRRRSSRRRRPSPSRSSTERRRSPGRRTPGEVGGGAQAERVSGGHRRHRLLGEAVVSRRAEGAGAHAVHPDPVAGVFDGSDLGKLDDRRLRREPGGTDVAEHQVGAGLTGKPGSDRRAERAAGPVDHDDPSPFGHSRSPSPAGIVVGPFTLARSGTRSDEEVAAIDIDHRREVGLPSLGRLNSSSSIPISLSETSIADVADSA